MNTCADDVVSVVSAGVAANVDAGASPAASTTIRQDARIRLFITFSRFPLRPCQVRLAPAPFARGAPIVRGTGQGQLPLESSCPPHMTMFHMLDSSALQNLFAAAFLVAVRDQDVTPQPARGESLIGPLLAAIFERTLNVGSGVVVCVHPTPSTDT